MHYLFPEHIIGMDRRAVAKKSNKWRKKKNVGNNTQQVKELVYFSDDTILEAVKFLNYERWSQMRFLCHRVNQLIQNNQSKLQAFEVQSLSMEKNTFRRNSIASFDQGFKSTDAVRKWFQDRGYSCDETADILLDKVFVGMNLYYSGNALHFTIRAFFEKPREKNIPLPQRQAKRTGKTRKKQMRKKNHLPNAVAVHSKLPQVFSAKFNAEYEFYGPILSHFFRLLHHPTAYFREVSMFPPMTDKFCDMSHSPIRCDQFTLKNLDYSSPFAGLINLFYLTSSPETSDSSLERSLKWLKDNVRAHQVILSFYCNHAMPSSDLHSLVSEFLLLESSICAKNRIKLDSIPEPGEFVNALIKKYETLEVTKSIPSILIKRCPSTVHQYLESNLVLQDDLPLYDKRCDRCNLKTYQLQNKLDANRKMIAQFIQCFKGDCLYYGSILHMSFE